MAGTPSAIPLLSDGSVKPGDPTVIEWIALIEGAETGVTAPDLRRLLEFSKHAKTLRDVHLSAVVQWRSIALRYIARPNYQQ